MNWLLDFLGFFQRFKILLFTQSVSKFVSKVKLKPDDWNLVAWNNELPVPLYQSALAILNTMRKERLMKFQTFFFKLIQTQLEKVSTLKNKSPIGKKFIWKRFAICTIKTETQTMVYFVSRLLVPKKLFCFLQILTEGMCCWELQTTTFYKISLF